MFDPITLAMAKKYTDEKCAGGTGGGLPMVELSTMPTAEGVKLSPDDIEAIVATGGMPFVGKFAMNLSDGAIVPLSLVFSGVNFEGLIWVTASAYLDTSFTFNINNLFDTFIFTFSEAEYENHGKLSI